jgi:protocatechuate 3,4-dioxygenase beta subunit
MKRHTDQENQITRNFSRREVLSLIAATTTVSLVGCTSEQPVSGEQMDTAAQPANATVPECVDRPQQTEGPYFVDDRLNRSDIRSEPSDGKVSEGVPLRVVLNVRRITGSSCVPLSGAVVDLWQCDALGNYSDSQDFNGNFDTRGKKFLRGYQTTDRNGRVEFTTVYPGWYPGRTVHIHFKIRTDAGSARGYEFTSQLYFDDALTDQIHTQAPYSSKGQRRQRNDRDGIYRRGGNELMLQVSKDGPGYLSSFDIGLQMA